MKINYDYQDLFDQIGLSELAPEEKEKRFQEMQDIIEKEVFLRIWSILSEEEKDEFEKLEDDDVFGYLEGKNVNLPVIITDVVQEYRESVLADMAYFESKLNKK